MMHHGQTQLGMEKHVQQRIEGPNFFRGETPLKTLNIIWNKDKNLMLKQDIS